MRTMKRLLVILLVCAAVLGGTPLRAFALTPYPKLEGSAAILLDMTTGEVLYEMNADERHFPASTTKMMTGLLAIDITVDAEAASTPGSGIKLREGEIMNVDVMLHAMLIPSSNDCAVAIAKAVSGGIDNFAVLMNARARELGWRRAARQRRRGHGGLLLLLGRDDVYRFVRYRDGRTALYECNGGGDALRRGHVVVGRRWIRV